MCAHQLLGAIAWLGEKHGDAGIGRSRTCQRLGEEHNDGTGIPSECTRSFPLLVPTEALSMAQRHPAAA
jgi:hypothetical protein